MATDKNTKSKASGDGSRVRSRHGGLMALESRVLFSAAPLMADLPGLESANYGAAAIEAALLPGDKLGADLGQINGLVPTPPGESKNDGHGIWATGASRGIWTDGTTLNLHPQSGSEHFPPPGVHDSVHCLVNNLWHDAIPEEDELGITFPDWVGPPGISAAQCQAACYVVEGEKISPCPAPTWTPPF